MFYHLLLWLEVISCDPLTHTSPHAHTSHPHHTYMSNTYIYTTLSHSTFPHTSHLSCHSPTSLHLYITLYGCVYLCVCVYVHMMYMHV